MIEFVAKTRALKPLFFHSGGKHDVYKRDSDEEQVLRHNEINDLLLGLILELLKQGQTEKVIELLEKAKENN